MSEKLREGWLMPARSRKYHYFVEGRSLCNGWIFPDYNNLLPDTGNTERGPDDCAECFKKLVKLRASRASDSLRFPGQDRGTAPDPERSGEANPDSSFKHRRRIS